MHVKKASVVVVAALCAGLAIAGAILLVGLQFHPSSHGGDHAAGRPAFVKELPASYADAWIDPIVLATISLLIVTGLLAIFTYLLYSTASETARQAKEASAAALEASTEATKLAREDFNATHRPELIIREVSWEMVDMDGGEVVNDEAITLTLVNRGTNSCTIIESAFELRSSPPDGRALSTAGANLLEGVNLAPGQFGHFRYALNAGIEFFAVGARGLSLSDCYFRGTLFMKTGPRSAVAMFLLVSAGAAPIDARLPTIQKTNTLIE